MLHREAVQFTPLRTERPCTARPLFREEAMFGDGLLGESGQVCPHTFFFFFFWCSFLQTSRAGVLAGREDSVVVPRGSQWHQCGDGDCALSSPVK